MKIINLKKGNMKKKDKKPKTEDSFLELLDMINDNATILDTYDASVRVCGEHEGIMRAGVIASGECIKKGLRLTYALAIGVSLQVIALAISMCWESNIITGILLCLLLGNAGIVLYIKGYDDARFQINSALRDLEYEYFKKVLELEKNAKQVAEKAQNKKGETKCLDEKKSQN